MIAPFFFIGNLFSQGHPSLSYKVGDEDGHLSPRRRRTEGGETNRPRRCSFVPAHQQQQSLIIYPFLNINSLVPPAGEEEEEESQGSHHSRGPAREVPATRILAYTTTSAFEIVISQVMLLLLSSWLSSGGGIVEKNLFRPASVNNGEETLWRTSERCRFAVADGFHARTRHDHQMFRFSLLSPSSRFGGPSTGHSQYFLSSL